MPRMRSVSRLPSISDTEKDTLQPQSLLSLPGVSRICKQCYRIRILPRALCPTLPTLYRG